MLCGWGVKAGMVREWLAGKLCDPLAIMGHIRASPAMGSSHNRALYKCPITLLTLLIARLRPYFKCCNRKYFVNVTATMLKSTFISQQEVLPGEGIVGGVSVVAPENTKV